MKLFNIKTRRLFSVAAFFVLLISLSACTTAGNPTGKLDSKTIYAEAGDYKITKGELWNELKWNANTILEEKIEEVVLKEYYNRVEVAVDKGFNELSDSDKKLFKKDMTAEEYEKLKKLYQDRLEDYVIEDVYNFSFDSIDSYEKIENVNNYDAKKYILKYEDEMYTNYSVRTIDSTNIKDLLTEAAQDEAKRTNYFVIAKFFRTLYFKSLAKELLAFDTLEDDIKEAYEDRDRDDEDDIGYFTKSQYTTTFKSDFANQGDLNMILIRFSTSEEFSQTLRSFGLKTYNDELVFIPTPEGKENFSEYCKYYDKLTTSQIKDSYQSLSTLDILKIYIAMYNYLYGGYRDMIYEDYKDEFKSVDLRSVTEEIRKEAITYQDEKSQEEALKAIVSTLKEKASEYDVDTIYTRDEIDDIDTTFNTYLYEKLALPYSNVEDDSKPYSIDVQSYGGTYWIAFKLEVGADSYLDIYDKNTVDDDLYDSIVADEQLKKDIEEILKRNSITSSYISNSLSKKTKDVKVSIYDEALEIAYAKDHSDYSKTYGSAPNSNVIAVLKYDNKSWNLNIVADSNDKNALIGGVYDILEAQKGITTAIDYLSQKVVKSTKAYEETKKDIAEYKEQIEYVLAAFSNNYYSSNGYPATIGKYNFMMLYFHTANIDMIVDNTYRINAAAAKLLTNYNSDDLLNFFKDYTDHIYDNYFSISGQRLLVYLDGNDDNKKDKVKDWTEDQKKAAKQLILKISEEVSSITGAHSTTLNTIVTEIKESARATFEDNPIAKENKWAEYRKLGLNVEIETVSAQNSTTSIDFKLKERMLEIFKSADYSINKTTPTEYIENVTEDTILETDEGYNFLLITSADFQTSAEFKKEDDKLGVFESLDVYYNEEYHTITDLYNEDEKLNLEQIRLYVLEYIESSTSNLTPSAISNAITSFLKPVLTRYTNSETQRELVIYLIETRAGKLVFNNQEDRYQEILNINHKTADDYIDVYFEEDTTDTLKTYEHWWTDLQDIVSKILWMEGGNQ